MFQTEEERIKVNAIRQVLTILGLIFGFIVPLLFISDTLAESTPRLEVINQYQTAGIVIAIATLISMLITFIWGCRERKEFKREPYNSPGFIKALKYTVTNKSFLTYVIAGLMCWTVFSILPSLINLYGVHILNVPSSIWIGILLGSAFISGAILVFLWRYIGRKIGVRKAFILSLITFAISLQPLLFINNYIEGLIVFLTIGLGLAGPIYFIDLIISHIVDEDELRTGVRREGMYYGSNGVIIRFSTVISYLAINLAFNSTGWYIYDPGAGITPMQILALRLLLSVFPAILLIIGIIVMYFYPLHGEKLKEVLTKKAELHSKKLKEVESQ